ncbi:MAG: hypothetical protein C0483_09005 [Pirellula sp.]|nr:hypothetical protein [Pirellula sp.]
MFAELDQTWDLPEHRSDGAGDLLGLLLPLSESTPRDSDAFFQDWRPRVPITSYCTWGPGVAEPIDVAKAAVITWDDGLCDAYPDIGFDLRHSFYPRLVVRPAFLTEDYRPIDCLLFTKQRPLDERQELEVFGKLIRSMKSPQAYRFRQRLRMSQAEHSVLTGWMSDFEARTASIRVKDLEIFARKSRLASLGREIHQCTRTLAILDTTEGEGSARA